MGRRGGNQTDPFYDCLLALGQLELSAWVQCRWETALRASRFRENLLGEAAGWIGGTGDNL